MVTKSIFVNTGLFLDNTFLDDYVNLINANRKRKAEKRKTNKHHILPHYCFLLLRQDVDNSESNLVNLLFSDHVKAHLLLAKCSSTKRGMYSNLLAVSTLCNTAHVSVDELDFITADELNVLYEQCAEVRAKITSDTHTGRKHSAEHVAKISAQLLGRICITDGTVNTYIWPEDLPDYEKEGWVRGSHWVPPQEWVEDIRKRQTGRIVSEETREKNRIARSKQTGDKEPALGHKMSETSINQMREKLSQQICVNNGIHEVHVYPEEYENYINNGYIKGRVPRAWVMKNNESKSIYARDLDEYLANGWVKGRGKLKSKDGNCN